MFSLRKQIFVYLFFFCFLCREKPPVKEARRPPAPSSWLQRDLKVRFIDKAFKGGRYYNSKVPMHEQQSIFSLYPLTQTSLWVISFLCCNQVVHFRLRSVEGILFENIKLTRFFIQLLFFSLVGGYLH